MSCSAQAEAGETLDPCLLSGLSLVATTQGPCAASPPWRLGPLIRAGNGAGGGECFQGRWLVSVSSWSSFEPGLSYKQGQSGNHLVQEGLAGQDCALWPHCPTMCALCLNCGLCRALLALLSLSKILCFIQKQNIVVNCVLCRDAD